MAEIVNLREFRKNKDRKAKAAKAARNRVASGLGKLDKAKDRDTREREQTAFDGKKLEGPSTSDDDNRGST